VNACVEITDAQVEPGVERSLEDNRDAHDAWLRGERLNREVRVRASALGFICTRAATPSLLTAARPGTRRSSTRLRR
jgi:hypothetical protein